MLISHPCSSALRSLPSLFSNSVITSCQKSFEKLKAILKSDPVLLAPSFDKEFKLAIDASDVGAGSVLLQEDDNGVDHPVCYYSKEFNKHQINYSTVE